MSDGTCCKQPLHADPRTPYPRPRNPRPPPLYGADHCRKPAVLGIRTAIHQNPLLPGLPAAPPSPSPEPLAPFPHATLSDPLSHPPLLPTSLFPLRARHLPNPPPTPKSPFLRLYPRPRLYSTLPKQPPSPPPPPRPPLREPSKFLLPTKRSPRSIAATGGAIGCYLRFRSMSGDRVSDLSAAIPRAAHWRLASLPEVLTDAEINELLRSFDHPFPSRQRAYAMVRCLIDLGLRCSEVVKLQLDDVNWADGTINLVETKGGRADVLPLPSVTGAAIASYLREERPPTSNRAIFVRHVAPTTNRSSPRLSSGRSWPVIEDVDGRGPESTFSGTAWPADFFVPERR